MEACCCHHPSENSSPTAVLIKLHRPLKRSPSSGQSQHLLAQWLTPAYDKVGVTLSEIMSATITHTSSAAVFGNMQYGIEQRAHARTTHQRLSMLVQASSTFAGASSSPTAQRQEPSPMTFTPSKRTGGAGVVVAQASDSDFKTSGLMQSCSEHYLLTCVPQNHLLLESTSNEATEEHCSALAQQAGIQGRLSVARWLHMLASYRLPSL